MFFPFDSSIASTVYASVRALAVGLLTIDHHAFVSRYTANLVVHLTASYVTKKYYQIEDRKMQFAELTCKFKELEIRHQFLLNLRNLLRDIVL